MKQLIHCNSLDWLAHNRQKFRMIFADPPDNIGLKYAGFTDKVNKDEYRNMLWDIISSTEYCDVLWLSFYHAHTPLVGHLSDVFLTVHTGWEFKACVQPFTFGQHNKHDLGNNYRPLYRFMRKGTELYPDQVKIPSWRQLNGDKRAKDGGRVPGDVFNFIREAPQADVQREILLLQREKELLLELDWSGDSHDGRTYYIPPSDRVELHGWYVDGRFYGATQEEAVWRLAGGDESDDDVFDFPRVTGNSKQRRAFSPTQLNESLYERCIKLCCAEGDTVVDLFAGSGTLGRVADRCGVNAIMLERSREVCDAILKDQPDVEEIK